MEREAILFGVLLPGLVSGVGLLLLARRTAEVRRPWDVLVVAAAFAVGYLGLFEMPTRPFSDRTLPSHEWLAWFALVGGPLLFLSGLMGRVGAFVQALFAGGALGTTLLAMYRHHWSTGESVYLSLGLFVVGALVWASTARLSQRAPGVSVPMVLLVTSTGLAVCSGLTGSARIAQITGLVCAVLGAAWIVAWIRPGFRLSVPTLTYVVVLLFALGLNARFFSELPTLDAALLAAGPLAAWAAELPMLRAKSPRVRTAVRILATALPVGAAVGRSAASFDPDPYAGYGDYGDY